MILRCARGGGAAVAAAKIVGWLAYLLAQPRATHIPVPIRGAARGQRTRAALARAVIYDMSAGFMTRPMFFARFALQMWDSHGEKYVYVRTRASLRTKVYRLVTNSTSTSVWPDASGKQYIRVRSEFCTKEASVSCAGCCAENQDRSPRRCPFFFFFPAWPGT